MEGLFQLLIIGFFIVASIFDAVARNRKRQEQKERMDADESGEVGAAPRPSRPARPRPTGSMRPGERRPGEGRPGRTKAPTGERTPSQGRRPKPATASRERETADAMIPEDFWAILTGQAPNPRTANPEPPAEPDLPVPVPSDHMNRDEGTEGWSDAEEAVTTRRSSRWMEGLDEQGDDHLRGGSPEAQVPVLAGTRPRVESSFPQHFGTKADPMNEPWGALEDISKGEIGDGRGTTQGAVDLYGEDSGRRRAGASDSPYVRLVATGRQEDLKAAIVLREVLGAPVGSRASTEGPGGWKWDDR